MKMEPVTTSATLRDLAHALRHPENDPPGFRWDYREGNSCAVGLAYTRWPASNVFRGLPPKEFNRMFIEGGGLPILSVLKTMLFGRSRARVARDIEAYLARR